MKTNEMIKELEKQGYQVIELEKIKTANKLLESEGYQVTFNAVNTGQWLKVPELGIEVEIEVHDNNKSWNELNLGTQEDKLLTAEQCIFLANNEKYSKILKMDGSSSSDDFFIKQPFNRNREKGYVAVFYVDSDGADLYCYGVADDSYSVRGVRFVRKISTTKKKGVKK